MYSAQDGPRTALDKPFNPPPMLVGTRMTPLPTMKTVFVLSEGSPIIAVLQEQENAFHIWKTKNF
jgi:hypothetical protein